MAGVMGKVLIAGLVISTMAACTSSTSSDGTNPGKLVDTIGKGGNTPSDNNNNNNNGNGNTDNGNKPGDNGNKKPGGNGGNNIDDAIAAYDTKSCTYRFSEGNPVDQGNLNKKTVQKVYFEKEFNRAYLDAVATADVQSTIDFANKTGITVYKSSAIKTKLCSYPMFANANSLPADVQKRWTEVAGDDGKNGGIILGLYLPKGDGGLASLKDGGAVIVRENTNRWTVVHEFMHHLFMLRAIENGYNQEADKARALDGANKIDAIVNSKDLTDAEKIAQLPAAFIDFAEGVDSQMVHFTLEEMTIEATLKSALKANQLMYVPEDSNWYIVSSGNTAKKVYESIEPLGNLLVKLVPADTEQGKKVKKIMDTIVARKATIASLTLMYPVRENLPLKDGILAKSNEIHAGCSHSGQEQKILELSRKVSFKTATFQKNYR